MRFMFVISMLTLAGVGFGWLPADFDCNGNVDVSDLSPE
jgi:hypothetical protein